MDSNLRYSLCLGASHHFLQGTFWREDPQTSQGGWEDEQLKQTPLSPGLQAEAPPIQPDSSAVPWTSCKISILILAPTIQHSLIGHQTLLVSSLELSLCPIRQRLQKDPLVITAIPPCAKCSQNLNCQAGMIRKDGSSRDGSISLSQRQTWAGP